MFSRMKIKVKIKSIEERYPYCSNYYTRYVFENDEGTLYSWCATANQNINASENEEWIVTLRGYGFNKGFRIAKHVKFVEKVG